MQKEANQATEVQSEAVAKNFLSAPARSCSSWDQDRRPTAKKIGYGENEKGSGGTREGLSTAREKR